MAQNLEGREPLASIPDQEMADEVLGLWGYATPLLRCEGGGGRRAGQGRRGEGGGQEGGGKEGGGQEGRRGRGGEEREGWTGRQQLHVLTFSGNS